QTPYVWSLVAGVLPAGLTVNTTTGLISGSPTAVGTPLFTVQARDGAGATATRQCSISAVPELVITTASLAGASTGASYADTVAATGGTLPYTWTVSGGALPPGLTLNAATGGVSGLPVQAGTFPFTVRIVDASGIRAEKSLSLTVGTGFSISACPAPAATVGQLYSSGLSLSGGGPSVVWSISAGTLPPGLDLVSSTGAIAGTPTQPGTSDFTVTANNGSSTSAARACSINVSPPGLTITSAAALPSGLMASSYDQTLAAAGGIGPYTWSVATGALPSGIALSDAGKLTGAPSAAGTFQFTLRVTDQGAVSATQVFTLKVLPAAAPTITFNGLPDIVGAAQQPVVSLKFDKGYPVPLKGKLVLQFTPDPTVGVDDKSISFVTGGRTVDFEVPANATQPNFPVPQLALQTGTVAGTITLAVQLSTGDIDITPPDAVKSIRIDRTAPVIVSVKVAPVTDGFEVSVTGYSTTREVSSATFQFTPAAGSRLESSDVTVSTAEAARTWYRDPRSNDYGSQFTFIQPFILRGATLSEVSVTLTNGQGTSPAVRAKF
ncbi:MAG: Ig domain-containing protein, partial [Bryobacteraceae bacterium]